MANGLHIWLNKADKQISAYETRLPLEVFKYVLRTIQATEERLYQSPTRWVYFISKETRILGGTSDSKSRQLEKWESEIDAAQKQLLEHTHLYQICNEGFGKDLVCRCANGQYHRNNCC